MYKFIRNRQFSLSDFNQPTGLKMNPENRWIKKSETIPWNEIEKQYASLFPRETGMPAKPLQTALGSESFGVWRERLKRNNKAVTEVANGI